MKTLLHLLILGLLLGLTPAFSATVTGRSAKTTLVGTEELPIDDSGTDKKVSVANLLLTPAGAMTADSINKVAITAPATSATLTLADGKTVTVNNSLTLAGTDGTTMTFPSGSSTVVTLNATQTLTNKTLTSPIFTAPTLGVATATSVNGLTIDTTTGTLDIANGKTLAASNSLTLAGTDGTTMTFPSGSGAVVTADSTVTMTNKTLTAPVMTTPTLGVASATSINKVAITAPASGSTLTIADGKTLTVNSTLTFSGTDSTTFTFPAVGARVFISSLATNAVDVANSVWAASNALTFEGSTANTSETSITATDPTADRTQTLPDASGTFLLAQANTAVSLTADNQAVAPAGASVIQLASDNATATNRTFTLSATGAIAGQIYVLIAPASNACELADTGIQRLSAAWSPDAADTLTLLFDGTNFNEIARSAN